MEHANETEKQVCTHCGYTEYDPKTGICGKCGFRFDEENTETTKIVVDMYVDRSICPVCGKTELLMEGSVCRVCGWFHDLVQINDPDWEGGQNVMSLKQAREAYSKGLPVR